MSTLNRSIKQITKTIPYNIRTVLAKAKRKGGDVDQLADELKNKIDEAVQLVKSGQA